MTGSGQGHTRNWMCALKRVMEVDAITCRTTVDKNRLSDDEHNKTSQQTSQQVWRTGVPARPKGKFWERVRQGLRPMPGQRPEGGSCANRRISKCIDFRSRSSKEENMLGVSLGKAGNAGKAGKAWGAGEGCGEPVSAVDVLLSDGPVRSVLEVHSQKLESWLRRQD